MFVTKNARESVSVALVRSDENFPCLRLVKGKLGELKRAIIDRPWADNPLRLHRTPGGFLYRVSRSSSDSCPMTRSAPALGMNDDSLPLSQRTVKSRPWVSVTTPICDG